MNRPEEKVADCKCDCEKCIERTTDTYRLKASCLNCGSDFVAEMRSGDTHPSMVDCPICGVYMRPSWGGVA